MTECNKEMQYKEKYVGAQQYWDKWPVDILSCFGRPSLMDAVCFAADSALREEVREHLRCNAVTSFLPHMPDHDWHTETRPGKQLQPYYGSVWHSRMWNVDHW